MVVDVRLNVGGGPYTFTAKRYTFTYPRMRMKLDHEKRDADLIERGNEVREETVVYGYVNENGNEEDSRSAATTWKARRSNSYRKRSCRARPTAPTRSPCCSGKWTTPS